MRNTRFPTIGNEYVFLCQCDCRPIQGSNDEQRAITTHLGCPVPRFYQWAHLRLPNGQIARYLWCKGQKSSDKVCISQNVKVDLIYSDIFDWTVSTDSQKSTFLSNSLSKMILDQESLGNCMGIPWGTRGQTHTHTHQKLIPTTMGTIPMVGIPTCTHIYQCVQAHFLICCCQKKNYNTYILIRRLG